MKKEIVKLLAIIFLFSIASTATANIIDLYGTTVTYKPYIISPTSKIYNSNNILLNVSFRAEVWGNTEYYMNYSLDGQENKSLTLVSHHYSWVAGAHDKSYVDGSMNLTGLANGLHTLTVYLDYAWEHGNATHIFVDHYYDNETVEFTINQLVNPTPTYSISPTPTIPEYPSQTLLILIALIAIAMISIVMKKTNIPKALNV